MVLLPVFLAISALVLGFLNDALSASEDRLTISACYSFHRNQICHLLRNLPNLLDNYSFPSTEYFYYNYSFGESYIQTSCFQKFDWFGEFFICGEVFFGMVDTAICTAIAVLALISRPHPSEAINSTGKYALISFHSLFRFLSFIPPFRTSCNLTAFLFAGLQQTYFWDRWVLFHTSYNCPYYILFWVLIFGEKRVFRRAVPFRPQFNGAQFFRLVNSEFVFPRE